MKKIITTNACYIGSMIMGVAALLCASGVENSSNGWAMLGWTLGSLALGGTALVLVALGSLAESDRKRPYGRIKRGHARTEEPEYRQNRRGA